MDSSESKHRARNWPYPRHSTFERGLRCVAADWFRAKGYPVNRRYPFILDSWNNWNRNIIVPEVTEYVKAERQARQAAGDSFPLHKYVHHGLSSQAMLFNLVGPLIVRGDLAPLRTVIESKGMDWPGGDVQAVFEFEDRTVFNENYGQPTSVDLVILGEAGPALYIEAKLVERGFGGCSVFADGDCDGRNPVDDLSTCYLHHIGRLYWQRLAEHGLGRLAQGLICPMTLYYQFFREMLFALHMHGCFILLHDERNPSFCCDGPKGTRGAFALLAGQLPPEYRSRVGSVSIQEIVAAVRGSGRHEDWVGEFQQKYGLT